MVDIPPHEILKKVFLPAFLKRIKDKIVYINCIAIQKIRNFKQLCKDDEVSIRSKTWALEQITTLSQACFEMLYIYLQDGIKDFETIDHHRVEFKEPKVRDLCDILAKSYEHVHLSGVAIGNLEVYKKIRGFWELLENILERTQYLGKEWEEILNECEEEEEYDTEVDNGYSSS